ncbi:MAG: 4-hydroxy-3-methylbut-2-enyl diphosphate reductase [Alphaproteobacteria bacterium]|jgi:4-hydroxy-3-methylbut-2-enyl diphosphate reductase|nr:4-hydroxy-3-methylbut-2-enyl diphosphate reductase [Alphaproteobacteria bacterium]MBT4848174.1 4-hydroxy-3-methylbut-2-enyl diphosphate reductase [Alphaproteobacteria bacterium]MBT5256046.1 4-hydroxy-3-methylbut-2-enyl diphosphate reductase [Alphaproteobacteria bacterium]MBT5482285.1 4-hydroxy-3-methylbut-2-enyl diphosphate reductase [Alphaproteobacteria bacterium]MBT5729234.1 4-hydroxy-3-methylbut-2-enyl diphosphate reductase [Alphaproteobacteria bacterium]|tara:strand:+ start:117 stop:1067 length:951 start_codon:yes stop_codon:yes gene_type:complete
MAVKPAKKLILAAPRGFCAGVDRAIRIVEVALEKYGAPVYVRHQIVHNKRVVDDLAAKGAVFVKELDEVPTGAPVIFSAHGVAKSVHENADRLNMIAIDATCPLVTKVHIEADRHVKNGRHILLIGHAGHPEVIGTMGQVKDGEMSLVETVEDAATIEPPENVNLAFASQTTLSTDETAEIISILQHRFPDISGPRGEDICYATTNRQNAVKALAGDVDLVLVIGAENSSNSKRLVEVALKAGAPEAHLIADASEINIELLDNADIIALSAGASAPEILVDEVRDLLESRYQLTIEYQNLISENMQFKLPSILTKA